MRRELVIVTKSTVPVGTAAQGRRGGRASMRSSRSTWCSNPEFLKEGAAVDDFMKPDRVVLGAESDHARSVMAELYAPFVRTGSPIIFMDIPSAEMTKYAANAMLATRISFMNEIANLCERVGANVDLVRRGIGIGRAHRTFVPLPGSRLRRLLLSEGREGARADGAGIRRSARRARGGRGRERRVRSIASFEKLLTALGEQADGHAHRGVGARLQAEHRRHARVAGVDADR